MRIHDWSQIEDGIFHHFHHSWIEEIQRALNGGALPRDYYALAEQRVSRFGPDVLTLQVAGDDEAFDGGNGEAGNGEGGTATLLARPRIRPTAETERDFYRGKRKSIAVRHASNDELIAMIEVVSRGNKSSRAALSDFVNKAAQLLHHRIHLLLLDLHPPGPRDPQGIHPLIWEEISGETAETPSKPLTFVSYDAGLGISAYVEPLAVGDPVPEMPLFLRPGRCVYVPLQGTYDRAIDAMPHRWREVLEANTRSARP